MFLANEQVVIQVYKSLFPHRVLKLESNKKLDLQFKQERFEGKGLKNYTSAPRASVESRHVKVNVSPRVERGMLLFKSAKE